MLLNKILVGRAGPLCWSTGLEGGEPLFWLVEGEGGVFSWSWLPPSPRVRFLITVCLNLFVPLSCLFTKDISGSFNQLGKFIIFLIQCGKKIKIMI